ncbi:MAG: hypothetical protein ACTSP3_13470 [Candidatus Heimdallarchaeaceae archaeon]
MIGQVRFAWIDFKRSFLTASSASLSQIIAISGITISVGVFSISRHQLKWLINSVFYRNYTSISILFIFISLIIGAIATIKTVDLKFKSKNEDIGIIKNIGGKNKWIYSYFVFNQLIATIISLFLGITLGVFILIIALASFRLLGLFNYILFMPILLANLSILLTAYLKSHFIILKYLNEKNLEETSSNLSNYKSIFELEALINKLKTTTKIALKNVIRSGKIISSLLYSHSIFNHYFNNCSNCFKKHL